jgi:uncharacterized protein YbaP (TraB family)
MNNLKKRKGILIVLLAVLLSLMFLHSREKGPEPGKSFIWEIQTKAGKSYVLGSVHALKKEHYPLKPAVEAAFTNTDILVVEANLSQDKIMEVAMLALKKGIYTGEETLKNNVSAKTYSQAKKILKEKNLDIENFEKFKPWMLALTLTSMEITKMGFDPNYGIDKYFLDRASGKREILELEGALFQVNMLDGFSKEEAENFLFSALQEAKNFKEELDGLTAAWEKGDAVQLEKLVNKDILDYPELKEVNRRLLDDRNDKMMEKILSYFEQKKTYLIVVGAAHLVGEKGLVKQLHDKGFLLKQL